MSSIKQTSEQLVDIETLFTLVYMLVDDWFLANPCKRVGRKAKFSDSEVVSLMLMMDFVPFPSERQFLSYVRANHLSLYPELLDQSQFNVRARGLRCRLEQLRQHWQDKLIQELQAYMLLDTKPVPVLSYKRDKSHSDFLGSADYGVCASRSMKYFGYKLVMLTSLEGIPLFYDLVPANTDERAAAEEILEHAKHSSIIADKGFVGAAWQQWLQDDFNITMLCPKRNNQKPALPKSFMSLMGSLRQRIEGVFHELTNLGKQLEKLLAKTVVGLASRVVSLIASHTLKLFLRRFYNIDVHSFSFINPG